MQVSVESIGALQRRMTVGVPKEKIQEEIQSRLRELARTTKLNGFRPGKVPLRVVERKFGGQVRQEVLGELVKNSFYEAVEQENLRLASDPDIDVESDLQNLDEGLSYTAAFEVYPELSVLNLEGFPVDKPAVEVTEGDVDNMFRKLQEQRKIWHSVDMPSEAGHQLTIVVKGKLDGEEIVDEDHTFVLGQDILYGFGFEDHLYGKRPKVDLTFAITYPLEGVNERLAGKTLHFDVYIENVANGELPPINEDFARALGVESGDLQTLRKDIRENMEQELYYASHRLMKQQIMQKLLEANQFSVPKQLLKEDIKMLLDHFKLNMSNEEIDEMTTTELRNQIPPVVFDEAEKRGRLKLIFSEVIRANEMHASPEKVREMIERIAATYEEPEKVIDWYYQDPERINHIESLVLEEGAVNWILEKAQINPYPSTFDAVMNPENTATESPS